MGVFLVVLLSILYGQKKQKEEPEPEEERKKKIVVKPATGPTGPTGPVPSNLSSLAQKFLKAVRNNVPNKCSHYGEMSLGGCASAGNNPIFTDENGNQVQKGCCNWTDSYAISRRDRKGRQIYDKAPPEYQTTCWQGESGEFCLGKPENETGFSPGFCSNCMEICQLDDNTIDYDCMATVCPDSAADHSDGDCFSTGGGMGCNDCDMACRNMKEDTDIDKALKKECVSQKCSALCDANKINNNYMKL